jgi:hypothetical protein
MGEPSRSLPPVWRPGDDGEAEPAAPGLAREPPVPLAEPSWPNVLATTFRLWLERRGLRRPAAPAAGPRSAWRRFGLLGLVLVIFAAGALTVALVRQASPGHPADPGGGSLQPAAAARADAADWVAGQVSRGAIVACDPVMCAALQARGFPAGNLLALGPSAADPLGSTVVVATAAVRNQFAGRLASEYAPVVLVSFGSGTARVQILVTAQDGAVAYRQELRADVRARQAGGARLLGNSAITYSAQARAALAAGQVDARLQITLAAMAHIQHLQILAFRGAGPGASPGVPLRTAELLIPAGAAGRGYLQSALALLRAQRAPLLASSMTTARLASGRTVLLVGFAAPSPFGLLPAGSPATHVQKSRHKKTQLHHKKHAEPGK